MYDRATRFLNSGTILDVGPGSYGTEELKPGTECDGYAPFSSLSAREASFLAVKHPNHAIPGPGSYEAKIIFDHIKGASTISNRAQRFNEKYVDTPGPGNYKVATQIAKDPGKPIIPTSKQLILRKSAPPSIPSPGQAFGYEEGRDGVLRKQKVPECDRSLGPSYYHVKHDDTAAVQKYKGVHFGQLTAKRMDTLKGKIDVPGPGTYSIAQSSSTGKLNSIIQEQKKQVDVTLPRYHEIVQMVECKKATPGPNKYEMKSQFQETDQIFDVDYRPPFGAKTRRFTSSKEHTPAPDSYDDHRHAMESCDRISGLKRTPFGQTSSRFPRPHHVTKTPAPDCYSIAGLAVESQKKALLATNLKGGFGSNEDRKFPFRKKEAEELPAPSQYTPSTTPVINAKRSAVFKSSTKRLPDATNNVPPPGSYDVPRLLSKSRVALCKVPSKSIDGGFLSSTKRFSQPRDIVVKKPDIETPGPGNYAIKNPSPAGISIVTKVNRFKDIENDIPGPGTYQLSPLLQHSVLKSTFNVTLNNPVEAALEEQNQLAPSISLSVTG